MATQDNEEKGGGGLLGGLKRTPGYAFAKAKQAANAYGVASTIAGTLGGNVVPAVPIFMVGREKYDRHKRGKQIEARTAAWKAPEDDPDSKYNPKTDTTLHEVRPAFGSTRATDAAFAATDAMFSPIDTLKRLLTRETGREGAEEPSELPKVVNDSDLGINENGEDVGVAATLGTQDDPYGLGGSGDSEGPVNYGLTNESSEAGMLQPMDEGVGSEQKGAESEEQTYDTDTRKYDQFGFPSDYEGEYDNANDEWYATVNEYNTMHSGTSDIKRDSPEGRALEARYRYVTAKLQEANKRKTDSDSATPGGGQSSTGGSTIDTSRRSGWDPDNDRGIKGALALSAVPQDRAQEIQNGRITLQGRSYDVVGNTGDKFLVPSPDQPDYSRLS